MEHARGPRRDGGGRGRDGDRRRAMWVDKYGPPTRTKYRMIVENLSTKMSWQVSCSILQIIEVKHDFLLLGEVLAQIVP